ncbi:FP25K [Epinotia aporema granulovirus]|uniref:FP25K n=1 Tax=Epinotia aporema granulovirus TaxID=166056 RepID=K4ER72_9BBAC|nr:FP25K [Epinotia aporema granulovirus]AER41539.1 FP25K [Epinotia aporema granulovirus]
MQTQHDIKDCVEIFGLGQWNDYNHCLRLIAQKLGVNYNDVLYCSLRGNGLLVKLIDNRAVNEWERRSREQRLTIKDLVDTPMDNKIKIFAAAPTKFKLLLHKVRNSLPNFKYIWIGQKGVMVRYRSRSQILLIKSENEIDKIKSND